MNLELKSDPEVEQQIADDLEEQAHWNALQCPCPCCGHENYPYGMLGKLGFSPNTPQPAASESGPVSALRRRAAI